MSEPDGRARRRAAASSPSSARPTPASPRSSTSSSAPRSSIVSHKVQTTRMPRARHRHGRRQPARVHRYARHLRAAPAPRARHGRGRLGRRRRGRHGGAAGRCRQGPRRGDASASSPSCRGPKATGCCWRSTRSTASRRSGCSSWRSSSMARLPFAATFMISALSGDGVADLKAHLARSCPLGPGTTPRTRSRTRRCACSPPRSRARRSTRACTTSCPTRPTVETTAWQEQNKAVRIEQTIYVERDSQKAIVLGNGGRMIRQLSMQARQELAGDPGEARAPLPVRQGARGLGGRSRALPRPRPEFPQGLRDLAGAQVRAQGTERAAGNAPRLRHQLVKPVCLN